MATPPDRGDDRPDPDRGAGADRESEARGLRERIERQHRALEAYRTAVDHLAAVAGGAPPVEIDPAASKPVAPGCASGGALRLPSPPWWPAAPLPAYPLVPEPGHGSATLGGESVAVIFVAVFGLAGDALDRKVRMIGEMQRRARNFAAVFLTDAADQRVIARQGQAFEYFPPAVHRGADGRLLADRLDTRLRLIEAKWNPRSTIDLSAPGDAGSFRRPGVAGDRDHDEPDRVADVLFATRPEYPRADPLDERAGARATRERGATAVPPWSFAIKITALRGHRYRPYTAWGDYHFADALKEALERLGHAAFVDPPWRWYDTGRAADDVVITIRGLGRYDPQPGPVNLLWNINHSQDVSYEEYEAYDLAYVASDSYAALLNEIVCSRVEVLLQATDPRRFRPPDGEHPFRHDILFVGNSRREYRDIVRWAIEEGFQPAIYGTGWEPFVPMDLVAGSYIDNRDLAAHYAAARVVLNDHFASMRDFGFVSNRLYDVVGSGGTVISDHSPAVARIFGAAVTTVRNSRELGTALKRARASGRRACARVAAGDAVRREHNFDERAKAIVEDVTGLLDHAGDEKPRPAGPAAIRGVRRADARRVHAVVRSGAYGPDDMAFVRLISPLTADAAGFVATFGDDRAPGAAAGADLCIVQSGAVGDLDRGHALIERLGASRTPLIVDIDRDPCSEVDLALISAADQLWFATEDLVQPSRTPAGVGQVVPSGIDPRYWKDYSPRPPHPSGDRPLRLVHVARGAPSGPHDVLWSALDRVAKQLPGSFNVTLVGGAGPIAPRTWLRNLAVPGLASTYPRFARWLRLQGPFDVGLVPAAAGAADAVRADIRRLEFAAMGLLPVMSGDPGLRVEGATAGTRLAAANSVEAWANLLERVIADPDAWRASAASAAAEVWDRRGTAEIAARQAELITAALGGG